MEYTFEQLAQIFGGIALDDICGRISRNLRSGVPEERVRAWIPKAVRKLPPKPQSDYLIERLNRWVDIVLSNLPPTDTGEQLQIK